MRRDFYIQRAENGVWYGAFRHFEDRGLAHGFSTRLGGRSAAPWAELNLGLRAGDDGEAVRVNRRLFCEALGAQVERAVTTQQVHSDAVYHVKSEDVGRGALDYDAAIPGTDALITNVPGIPLMLFFADCVPVFFYDPVNRAIGISHAGWKGTVTKIGQKTVLAMQERFGTKPADCLVGIGPSIGPCSYEVDETVVSVLRGNFTNWQELAVPQGDRFILDLWKTNRVQLTEIGVPEENIITAGICTACNTKLFFSHRAEKGLTGRMGGLIML